MMSANGQILCSSGVPDPPTAGAPPPPSSRSSAALLALIRPAVGPSLATASAAPQPLPGFSDLELDFFRRGDELDAAPVAA